MRIGPTNAESWNNLGVAYFFQNQHDKVREVYSTLRKLNPAMADKYASALMRTPGANYPDLPEANQLQKQQPQPQRSHKRRKLQALTEEGQSEVTVRHFLERT